MTALTAMRESVCPSIRANSLFGLERSRFTQGVLDVTFPLAINMQLLNLLPRGLVDQKVAEDSRQDGTALSIRTGTLRDALHERGKGPGLTRLAVGLGMRPDRPPAFVFDVHLDVEFSLLLCNVQRFFCINARRCQFSSTDSLLGVDRFTCVAPPNVRTCIHQQRACHSFGLSVCAAQLNLDDRRFSNFLAGPAPPEPPGQIRAIGLAFLSRAKVC